MPLLQDKDREQVQQLFASLSEPVKLVMFTQEFECELCKETRELVEEVASLSELITAEVYNLALDKQQAEEYGVDKIPAVIVVGEKDHGIRFFGIPSGYEFSTLLEDIMSVSAQAKAFIDRCQPFWAMKYLSKTEFIPKEKIPRRGAFISVGGTKYSHLFECPVKIVKTFFNVIEVEYQDELLLRGIDEKGAILKQPDALKRAYELGVRIAKA